MLIACSSNGNFVCFVLVGLLPNSGSFTCHKRLRTGCSSKEKNLFKILGKPDGGGLMSRNDGLELLA